MPSGDGTSSSLDPDNGDNSQELIESISTHAIFKLDAAGRIITWSGSATTLYGFESSDILNDHFCVLFADRDGPNPDLETVL